MNKERALELLEAMVEHIANGENTSTTIRTLIGIGFTKAEMEEMDFIASDIEEVYETIILEAVDEALAKYSSDNVDVVWDEEPGYLYVGYHSKNNSFSISGDLFPRDDVDLDSLAKELDKRNVGQCWW